MKRENYKDVLKIISKFEKIFGRKIRNLMKGVEKTVA